MVDGAVGLLLLCDVFLTGTIRSVAYFYELLCNITRNIIKQIIITRGAGAMGAAGAAATLAFFAGGSAGAEKCPFLM